MCRWSKEDFRNKDTRDTIPAYEFTECGETLGPYDIATRNNPELKPVFRGDFDSKPAQNKPPFEGPIATQPTLEGPSIAPPTASIPKEGIGLAMLAVGFGLIVWQCSLKRGNSRPVSRQNPID